MKGELWAMMLDPKGTFDEIVTRLEPDVSAREEILTNPIYRELSTAVAGSQELSAIAKLYELHHERDFDVIVLDTPPSRNALDFLDAPTRLLGFLEGRALKVFVSPGGLTARVFGRSTALVFAIFARVTGVDMLSDLSRLLPLGLGRDRRLRRSHPRRRSSCCASRQRRVPDRHLARARAGARGGVPRRRARRPGHVAGRADRQPRPPRRPRRPLRGGGGGAAHTRARRAAWRCGSLTTWRTSTCSSSATARPSPTWPRSSPSATRSSSPTSTKTSRILRAWLGWRSTSSPDDRPSC